MAYPFSQFWYIFVPGEKLNPWDFADGSMCEPEKKAEKHCLRVPPGILLRKAES